MNDDNFNDDWDDELSELLEADEKAALERRSSRPPARRKTRIPTSKKRRSATKKKSAKKKPVEKPLSPMVVGGSAALLLALVAGMSYFVFGGDENERGVLASNSPSHSVATPDGYFVLAEAPRTLAATLQQGPVAWGGSVTASELLPATPVELPPADELSPLRILSDMDYVGRDVTVQVNSHHAIIHPRVEPGASAPSYSRDVSFALYPGENEGLEFVKPTEYKKSGTTFKTRGGWKQPFSDVASVSPDDRYLIVANTRDGARIAPYAIDVFDLESQTRIARRLLSDDEQVLWVGFDAAAQPLAVIKGRLVGLKLDGDTLTERFEVSGDLAPPRSKKAIAVVSDRSRRFVLAASGNVARLFGCATGELLATIEPPEGVDPDARVQWLATNAPGNRIAIAWEGRPMPLFGMTLPEGERSLVFVERSEEDRKANDDDFGSWGDVAASGQAIIPVHPNPDPKGSSYGLPIDFSLGKALSLIRIQSQFAPRRKAYSVVQSGRSRKIFEEFSFGGPIVSNEAPGYRIEVHTVNGRYDTAAAHAVARSLMKAGFRICDDGGVVRVTGKFGKTQKQYFADGKIDLPTYEWTWEHYDGTGNFLGSYRSKTTIGPEDSGHAKTSTKRERIGGNWVQETTTVKLPSNYGEIALTQAIARGAGLNVRNTNGKIVMGL